MLHMLMRIAPSVVGGLFFCWLFYRIGRHEGAMEAHDQWANAFKRYGIVERGPHGKVMSIVVPDKGDFMKPSPRPAREPLTVIVEKADPAAMDYLAKRHVIKPTTCRFQAGGAACSWWCGNGECTK